MALNANIGEATSNSYVTQAEADTYFADRMHSSAWAAVTEKGPLLISASQMLDWYKTWIGNKVSSTQFMQWPRSDAYRPDGTEIDDAVIPPEIKTAVYELAFSSIEADRLADDPLAGVGQLNAGSLMIKAGPEKPNQTNIKALPSHINNILSDLIQPGSGLHVVRLMRA